MYVTPEMEGQLAELKARGKVILEKMRAEQRGTTPEEAALFDRMEQLGQQITELREQEARDMAAANHRKETGGYGSAAYVTDPQIYHDPKVDPHGPSFFRDLLSSRMGDHEASDRLVRNNRMQGVERRAGDMTSSGSGKGGEFAPPAWMVGQWIELARPGRVTADLLDRHPLPQGVSSINLPGVKTGTTTAEQTTQNTAVSDTAMTTQAVTGSIRTIAGKQIVAQQLIDQSGIDFDQVMATDLSADYAKQLDAMVLADLVGVTGIITVDDATASPGVTPKEVFGDVANAVSQISASRFMPPTALVMSPTRWYWLVSQVDSSNRPLVTPSGPAFNQLAVHNKTAAQGAVGELLGLPVYLDAQLPSDTSADVILCLRTPDLWLYESELRFEVFPPTYADQASVLFRVLGYNSFIARYPKSIAQIGGTGYEAVTFA